MFRIGIGILIYLFSNSLAAQVTEEEVYFRLDLLSYEANVNYEGGYNNTYVINYSVANTGETRCFYEHNANAATRGTSNQRVEHRRYTPNDITLNIAFWESDCGDVCTYDAGCDVNGYCTRSFPVEFKNFTSGIDNNFSITLAHARLDFRLFFMPEAYLHYEETHLGARGFHEVIHLFPPSIEIVWEDCDFSSFYSQAPGFLRTQMDVAHQARTCATDHAFDVLGGSEAKGIYVFYEYAPNYNGPWSPVPGSPVFSGHHVFDMNACRSNTRIEQRIYFRAYRKSLNAPIPVSTWYDNGGPLAGNLCSAESKRIQHVLDPMEVTAISPPPILDLTKVRITQPTCTGGYDGVVSIESNSITSWSDNIFEVSMRECSDTSVCIDSTEIWTLGLGTKRFQYPAVPESFQSLRAGYKVLQVSDIERLNSPLFHGCPANYLVYIPEKAPLEFTYSKKKYTRTDISCAGVWDGEVTLDIDGGSKPYRVTHDSSRTVQSWITLPATDSTHSFTGLRADSTYHLAVTDFYDCPLNSRRYVYDSVRLISPDTLRFFELYADTFRTDRFNPGFRNVTCKDFNDGEVHVLLGSGRKDTLVNFPVNFWITGITNQGAVVTTPEEVSSVSNYSDAWNYSDFPDFYAGKYLMHVRDNNGCLHSDSIKLYEPPQLRITVTDSIDNRCFGDQKGNFTVFANGGTRPYWFNKTEPHNPLLVYRMCAGAVFSNGECISNDQRISQTEDSTIHISNLLNGTHTIRVLDQNNCIAEIATTLSSPPRINLQLEDGRVTCHDGTDGVLAPEVSGGIAPYTYQWKKNDLEFSTASSLSNLSPGSYSLDVKDVNNCPSPVPASAQVRNPMPLTARVDVQRIPSCADAKDAQILVTPNGGWLEGSVYQISIDGINWIKEGLVISNLGAGNYTVFVKDGAGCQIEIPNVLIAAPDALTADVIALTDVSCHGGNNASRVFELSGGTAGYKVTWNSNTETLSGTTYTIGGLEAGIHTITFEDARGCLLTQTVVVSEPEALTLSINSVSDASPFSSDGSASIQADGGVAPYTYSYSGGSGTTTPFTMENLYADLHPVTITDANFCVVQTEVPVSNVGGPRVSTISFVNPTCSYSTDGSINLSVTGNAPFTFDWSHNDNDSTAEDLGAGEYFVRIEDAIGLIAAQKITLTAPEPLRLLASGAPSLCHNECKGTIHAQASGGNGGYSLLWNNGATSTVLTDLCAATYAATLTDVKGCTTSVSVTLPNPPALTIDLGNDITLCSGQQYLLAATSGWKTYQWSYNDTENTGRTLMVSQAGTYHLKVTNENFCEAIDSVEVMVSATALEANFLVSTRAYPGETSVLIDETWPRPDRISWVAENPDSAIVERAEGYKLYVYFPHAGTFWFRMVAELGECKDTVRSYVKVYERGDEEGYENFGRTGSIFQEVNVFPNPAMDHATVKVELLESAQVTVALFDSWGKLVRFIETESDYLHQTKLDLSKLGQGAYLVQIRSGNEMKSITLTIQ